MKKKAYFILCAAVIGIVLTVSALLLLPSPSASVWDMAELVQSNDDFYIWITDIQHHHHFINSRSEQHTDALKILNGLKVSRRETGENALGKLKNRIVLETYDHHVQYFAFNDDFTEILVVDNSWIWEDGEVTQLEEIREVYKVKNPGKLKRFFKEICDLDTGYDFEKDT